MSVRCSALTKDGSRCKLKTARQYPLCWIHLKKEEGTQVKKSDIKNAGLGLFYVAKNDFKKDRKIADYSAKEISSTPNPNSKYVFEVGKNRYLDGEDKLNYVGRYINSSKNSNKAPNVRFTKGYNTTKKMNRYTVPIFSKRGIKKGEELLLNYGKNFRF